MRVVLPAAAMFLLLAAFGCNRPTQDQCEDLCRTYSELAYWEQANEEIEQAPPEERERLRAEKEKEWEETQNDDEHVYVRRLDNCMTDCRQRADRDTVRCVKEAETRAQADDCLKD